MEDIIDHLAFCIRHDMSASAFLQRYTKPRPSSSYPGKVRMFCLIQFYIKLLKLVESVDWSVNCDEPLITHLRPGIVFSLNQLDYRYVFEYLEHVFHSLVSSSHAARRQRSSCARSLSIPPRIVSPFVWTVLRLLCDQKQLNCTFTTTKHPFIPSHTSSTNTTKHMH